MDGSFEILVPTSTDLGMHNFETRYYELDGVKYPQGAPETGFGNNFFLKIKDRIHTYSRDKWPTAYKDSPFVTIDVSGPGLDIFVASLFGLREEEDGYSLDDLLRMLLSGIDNWMIIYSYQYDGYRKVVEASLTTAIEVFSNAIRKGEEGILIYNQLFK